LITERRAARLAAVPSDRLHFNISLDGDEAASDLVRGAGMWRRAIDGYQRIREADAAAGSSRRKILANTILHAANIDRFESILDEQAALGFDGVQILNLFRAGPDAPREAANLWLRPRHYDELEALTERLAVRAERSSTAGYRIQNRPEDLRKIPSYYREALQPLDAPCWAGWKELYINADGRAIMCDGSLDFLAGAFGDVREQTLQELWRSPALEARRRVVKSCTTPCIQDCYLRRGSDSGRALVKDAGKLVARSVRQKVASRRRQVEHHPEAVLRLELTDVVPGGSRWAALIADCPQPPTPETWADFRDRGYLDFGRGFMGFEVVRSVTEDLLQSRQRFGTLALRWRGEPLLHPELIPILHYLREALGRGLADRLRIETDGRFLTDDAIECLSGAPIDWIVDLDEGGAAAAARLRGHGRLILQVIARPGLDVRGLCAAYPWAQPAAGRLPTGDGDWLWVKRADHEHYLKNAEARADLAAAAEVLGVGVELGEEDRPRRCRAPWRSPTVSWDGKVTLCARDVRLDNRVGEVTGGERLSEIWSSGLSLDRAHAEGRGVPDRALCRDCALPWSPNHP
ncbi:MAG: MoaA/NifB/PqqE/SkfB family radical SAM enzyme, partial [Myxococcota bacterium]